MKKDRKIYKKDVNKYLSKNYFNCQLNDNYGDMILHYLLDKITYKNANKKIKSFCKKYNLFIVDNSINIYTGTNSCHIAPKSKSLHYKIVKYTEGLCYGSIFPEVRQRVAAFKYYKEFWNDKCVIEFVDDFLDNAYRFLYQSIDPNFIVFCAKKEKMDPIEYIKSLTKKRTDIKK